MLPTKDPPQDRRPTQTESEGLEKEYSKQMDRGKKSQVSKLILNKIDFKVGP